MKPTTRLETVLYRAYSASMGLLYVGISANAWARIAGHKERSPWFGEAVWFKLQSFNTRKEAEAAELEAIRTERPKYNIAGAKEACRAVNETEQARRAKLYADEARQRALALLNEAVPNVPRIRMELQRAEDRGDAALASSLADFIMRREAQQVEERERKAARHLRLRDAEERRKLLGEKAATGSMGIGDLLDTYMKRYAGRDLSLGVRLEWWVAVLGSDREIGTIDNDAGWSGVDALQERGCNYFLGTDEEGKAIRPKDWNPLAPNTLLKYVGALRLLLNWANQCDLLPSGWVNPCQQAASVFRQDKRVLKETAMDSWERQKAQRDVDYARRMAQCVAALKEAA